MCDNCVRNPNDKVAFEINYNVVTSICHINESTYMNGITADSYSHMYDKDNHPIENAQISAHFTFVLIANEFDVRFGVDFYFLVRDRTITNTL